MDVRYLHFKKLCLIAYVCSFNQTTYTSEMTKEKEQVVSTDTDEKADWQKWHIPGVPGGIWGSTGLVAGVGVFLAGVGVGIKKIWNYTHQDDESESELTWDEVKEHLPTFKRDWHKDFQQFIDEESSKSKDFENICKERGAAVLQNPFQLFVKNEEIHLWLADLAPERSTLLSQFLDKWVMIYFATKLSEIVTDDQSDIAQAGWNDPANISEKFKSRLSDQQYGQIKSLEEEIVAHQQQFSTIKGMYKITIT